MQRLIGCGLCLLVWSCTPLPAPLPPVPPPPDDLSTWAVPELIQPPPLPVTATPPPDAPPTPAEKVFVYAPGATYTATVPMGWPLDIVLEVGEQVRNIVGGDRTPTEEGTGPAWQVKEGAEGQGDTLRSHVFVLASAPGLSLGLIITSNRRTYYLTCKSVQHSPIRAIRWRYPQESSPKTLHADLPPGPLPDPQRPAQYHVGYTITSEGQTPDWLPKGAWDNGQKMFVEFPITSLYSRVPLVRGIGTGGPYLLNSRHYQNIVIIDHLAPRLELRMGTGATAHVVTIARGELRTIDCPGNSACPRFPPLTLGRALP